MSSPPEDLEMDFAKFFETFKGSTASSTSTGDYNMYEKLYYQQVMPELHEYVKERNIRDKSKKKMIEENFYEWKYQLDPSEKARIEVRGSITSGTNTDKVEEPEEETPEPEVQYFDPKDLDI